MGDLAKHWVDYGHYTGHDSYTALLAADKNVSNGGIDGRNRSERGAESDTLMKMTNNLMIVEAWTKDVLRTVTETKLTRKS